MYGWSDCKGKIEKVFTKDELLSNVSHKTEEVITFLESKLADLKAQNAKLQK